MLPLSNCLVVEENEEGVSITWSIRPLFLSIMSVEPWGKAYIGKPSTRVQMHLNRLIFLHKDVIRQKLDCSLEASISRKVPFTRGNRAHFELT